MTLADGVKCTDHALTSNSVVMAPSLAWCRYPAWPACCCCRRCGLRCCRTSDAWRCHVVNPISVDSPLLGPLWGPCRCRFA